MLFFPNYKLVKTYSAYFINEKTNKVVNRVYYYIYYSVYRNKFILKSEGDDCKFHGYYSKALEELARLNEKTFFVKDVQFDFVQNKLNELNYALEHALQNENYEEATKIRDMIQQIQQKYGK
jgi:hypothetical protein